MPWTITRKTTPRLEDVLNQAMELARQSNKSETMSYIGIAIETLQETICR